MKSNQNIWDEIYHTRLAVIPYTEVFVFLLKNFQGNRAEKKLLEIGCGTLNNLAFAKWAFGCEVYGVDQSPMAIDRGKKHFTEFGVTFDHLSVGDVKNLDFSSNFFDAVIDRAVLQHNKLEDVFQIVSEIHRVLKVGGLFFTSLHSDNHLLFNQGAYLGQGDFYNEDKDGVRHFFSRSELLELFVDFEVIESFQLTRQDLQTNVVHSNIFHLGLRKKKSPG